MLGDSIAGLSAWRPGETHAFTLRWRLGGPLAGDYQVFVHLRNAHTGQELSLGDGPPCSGWYPTSWWPVGEPIIDRRMLSLPPDLPAGDYQLVVGLYDLASGERPLGEHVVDHITVGAP